MKVEDKRQGPPRLHDLPSLQKLCSSRFGWSASKTLEIAQELYDGQGKKIITYPRAEVRYLPENLIADVPKLVAGLQVGQSFKAIPVPGIFKEEGAHDISVTGEAHSALKAPSSHRLKPTAGPDLPRIWLVRKFGTCVGPQALPKGILHLNGEPIASPFAPRFKCK